MAKVVKLNDHVVLTGDDELVGTVRWVSGAEETVGVVTGCVCVQSGYVGHDFRYGLELAEPRGKNDGAVRLGSTTKRYFKCQV